MIIQSRHHWPSPKLILGMTFLGAVMFHQYTHGIRDYFNNGFYIFGNPDIDYLTNVGWWPKYFIYPLIIALPTAFRVRLYQISISDFSEGEKLYKKIIILLRKQELEILEQKENACSFLPQWRSFSDRFFHSDLVKVYHIDNKIEIIGRQKFIGELEYYLIRMNKNNSSIEKLTSR
ncbi:hypothetical protein KI659_17120 [Litoribacter alkaliphilus]|uniref:Uncharacterized protein n=1 Tax=Litoribacter ruber TaxID=702568 RepID=A0AAP2CL28_9BACT|nr:hypothetical protein [Litoribacter alkaliphilus]MBS9525744.1 hypothetical protein [Litoribacter alkaliphilus]